MHAWLDTNRSEVAPESYWQATSPALQRASGALPSTTDIVVVGGGLLCTATAYWLARAGAAPV